MHHHRRQRGQLHRERPDQRSATRPPACENAQENLEDYSITAPISGTVVTKTAKAGDNIEGGSSGTLCTIYDLSYLEMTMSIDDVDISSVEVGQEVRITADAVEGTTYTGVVTEVSVAGTTSGGITTYPVTVQHRRDRRLLPGMNVDAEIVVSSADDVLAIPSAAVSRGDMVLVTADSPSAANALGRGGPGGLRLRAGGDRRQRQQLHRDSLRPARRGTPWPISRPSAPAARRHDGRHAHGGYALWARCPPCRRAVCPAEAACPAAAWPGRLLTWAR